MAGPSRDNPKGFYQDLVEFVRIFDPMGETLEAVGQLKPSSNQPEGPRTPDVTTETDQDPLLKTPPGCTKICVARRENTRVRIRSTPAIAVPSVSDHSNSCLSLRSVCESAHSVPSATRDFSRGFKRDKGAVFGESRVCDSDETATNNTDV
jgi:hypothetical protein